MKTNHDFAKQALSLIDLTSLNESDTDELIVALCKKAMTPFGNVAAVCVYPQFVATAKQQLRKQGSSSIKVATVTNFPSGEADVADILAETNKAILDGADEIDVVIDYQQFNQGNEERSHHIVAESKSLCQQHNVLLKVIIETGELTDLALVKRASEMAIAAGADFIKTSTGKVPVNATLEFADVMLNVIKSNNKEVGFKAAGGIRSIDDATAYILQAQKLLNTDLITADVFRFGASGLLDNLLAVLDGIDKSIDDDPLSY